MILQGLTPLGGRRIRTRDICSLHCLGKAVPRVWTAEIIEIERGYHLQCDRHLRFTQTECGVGEIRPRAYSSHERYDIDVGNT